VGGVEGEAVAFGQRCLEANEEIRIGGVCCPAALADEVGVGVGDQMVGGWAVAEVRVDDEAQLLKLF
jgi:hypothetical protein